MGEQWKLDPDRYFDPEPSQRRVARELYDSVARLPIVSPHGHVAPQLFADADAVFRVTGKMICRHHPDHYVFECSTRGHSPTIWACRGR